MKKTQRKELTYLLCDKSSPLSFYVKSRDSRSSRLLYFDEETGRNRALRYAKNQQSPFLDEQDDTAIIEPIVFEEGVLIVPETNPILQTFLDIHPDNKKNGGGLFYEYDPEKEAKELMRELDLRTDAIIAAKSLDLNKAISIARTLLDADVDKMSSAEIKYDVMLFAENYPQEFLDAIDDPDMDVNNLAARAFKEQYVTFRAGKDIYYNMPDNKKKLMTVPHGMKPENALATWLHSDEGLDFHKVLSNIFE